MLTGVADASAPIALYFHKFLGAIRVKDSGATGAQSA